MIAKDDIITLKFKFELKREDVPTFMRGLTRSTIIKTYLCPDAIKELKVLSLASELPDTDFMDIHQIYKEIRKKGYPFKKEKFLKEIYYLEAFGLIDSTSFLGQYKIKANPTRIYEITVAQ